MVSEDDIKLALYWQALCALSKEDDRYNSNCTKFFDWEDELRLWWIGRMEKEAQLGLPFALTLITKVVALRMKK